MEKIDVIESSIEDVNVRHKCGVVRGILTIRTSSTLVSTRVAFKCSIDDKLRWVKRVYRRALKH